MLSVLLNRACTWLRKRPPTFSTWLKVFAKENDMVWCECRRDERGSDGLAAILSGDTTTMLRSVINLWNCTHLTLSGEHCPFNIA